MIDEAWRFHNETHELCRYIAATLDSENTLWLVGHNVFFDLQCSDFFYFFTLWGYRLNFYYDKGLVYILIVAMDKKRLTCISTTNWYDTDLRGLGKMIDLPKLDIDFDAHTREEIITYCRRDVEIVIAAMEHYMRFVYDNDLGQLSPTNASQAFHAYRHRFMTIPIYMHEDETVRVLERNAYYGGRVECCEMGQIQGGPFIYLDVNSMYPYIMLSNRLPTKLVEYHQDYSMVKLDMLLDAYCAVAEVELLCDKPIYAVRYKNKIIFPTGHFETWLCSSALRHALHNDHLIKIKQIALYRSDYIFRDYVDFFYGLKQQYDAENKRVMRTLTKKMLNSLYGKFAQRRPVTQVEEQLTYDGYFREECFNLVTGEHGTCYKMFNTYVEQYGSEDTDTTFTAISAHITECARMLLWEIIDGIGHDRVIYCDTDSVIIRKKDLDRVKHTIDDGALGALKIERTIDTFDVYGPKCYVMDDKRVFKGVPKNATELGGDKFAYQTFLRQSTHMQREVNQWYIVRDTVKQVKRSYDKGIVLPDGSVRPYIATRDNEGAFIFS
jgi:hypothetical protein